MTEDTENRVNTHGGKPEEESAENGASEAESETAEKKSGAQSESENDAPIEDKEHKSCKEPQGECSDSAAEKTKPQENESTGKGEDSGQDKVPKGKDKDNETCKTEAVLKESEKLKADLDTANGQLKKQKEMFMRTVAEYDNYRKRTEREKAAVYSDATAAAVKEILSVEDNLSRALEQKECSAQDLRKGIEMVEKQMRKALKKLGVTEMGKEGETFDPALHNAVSHVEDENIGENTIAEVFQKGYMLDGKVVRHAMVKVAN